jgi:hypothetical protein
VEYDSQVSLTEGRERVVYHGYDGVGNLALVTEEYCGGSIFHKHFTQDAFGNELLPVAWQAKRLHKKTRQSGDWRSLVGDPARWSGGFSLLERSGHWGEFQNSTPLSLTDCLP